MNEKEWARWLHANRSALVSRIDGFDINGVYSGVQVIGLIGRMMPKVLRSALDDLTEKGTLPTPPMLAVQAQTDAVHYLINRLCDVLEIVAVVGDWRHLASFISAKKVVENLAREAAHLENLVDDYNPAMKGHPVYSGLVEATAEIIKAVVAIEKRDDDAPFIEDADEAERQAKERLTSTAAGLISVYERYQRESTFDEQVAALRRAIDLGGPRPFASNEYIRRQIDRLNEHNPRLSRLAKGRHILAALERDPEADASNPDHNPAKVEALSDLQRYKDDNELLKGRLRDIERAEKRTKANKHRQ